MMTFSTFLARYGVGGGTSPRRLMPKKYNNSGINALKKRIAFNEKNIEEFYSDLNKSDDSFNLNDEGEDYFDDDFGMNNNIFYWTGHYYDYADFL